MASALILLACPSAKAASCPRGSLSAVVTQVWSGDTIKVGTVPIRLQGLAAPAATEQGGERASVAMEKLVLGREVRCEVEDEHRQGRCVGVCYLDGHDIAMTMVRQGLARDCPRASDRRYANAEYQAAVERCDDRLDISAPNVLQSPVANDMRSGWMSNVVRRLSLPEKPMLQFANGCRSRCCLFAECRQP
jgi:micrococcal nuclease